MPHAPAARPAPRRGRGVLLLPGVALLLAPLGGCGGAVDLGEEPDLPAAQAAACADLLAAVPDALGGLERRDAEPAAAGAAWGDPAVVLRCGATTPEGLDPFSQCEDVEGVGWYVPPEALGDPAAPITVTTIGVEPAVSLTYPPEQRGTAAATRVELAPLLVDALETGEACEPPPR